MELHEKLKALRLHNHFTQQEIADKLGVTRSTISNFEIGRRKPEVYILEKIAAIYHVDLNFFSTIKYEAKTKDVVDFIERAESIFKNPDIEDRQKENVYHSLIKLYIAMKEGAHHD